VAWESWHCARGSGHISLPCLPFSSCALFLAPLSRPGLQGMVGALQATAVEEASSKAFAAMPDLKEALKEMTVLKGVGPATASALLAAHSPHVAPFMSDEVRHTRGRNVVF